MLLPNGLTSSSDERSEVTLTSVVIQTNNLTLSSVLTVMTKVSDPDDC